MEFVVLVVVAFAFFSLGGLKGMGSIYRKSDAAAAAQKLLEQQALFSEFSGDHLKAVREYVDWAWDEKPKVFNGPSHLRPDRLTTAIYAMAIASRNLRRDKDRNADIVLMALINGLNDMMAAGMSGRLDHLRNIDLELLKEAMSICEALAGKDSPVMDEISVFLRQENDA